MNKFLSLVAALTFAVSTSAVLAAEEKAEAPAACGMKTVTTTKVIEQTPVSCASTKKAPKEKKAKKPVKKAEKRAMAPDTPVRETVVPTPTCSADGCGNTVKTVVEKTVVERVTEIRDTCIANGVTYPVVNGICQVPEVKVIVPTVIVPTTTAVCATCGSRPAVTAPSAPVAAAPASQPATCATCGEKVEVVREEKRTDGRCFVQTNMGYKFEVRANASNGRLMAGLVNPQDNQTVAGTRAMYVSSLQAAHNAQGYDCDGMQAQLYSNWEAVRSAYGIPSVCQLALNKKN